MNTTHNSENDQKLYDNCWPTWLDMKIYGPASRWLRSLLNEILHLLDCKFITNILDVGCGEGTITFSTLVSMFPSAYITGIDFSKTAINAAKERYHSDKLTFIHDMKSSALNFQYSLVTCFEVLEHVEKWQNLLRSIAMSSKHYIMISVPVGRMRPFEKNVGHLRNFEKGQIEKYLLSLNFKPLIVYYAGFPFYSPIYRELCNITNSANNAFTKGSYGWQQKLVSHFFFFCFKYLSSKRRYGDQFVGLFARINV